MDVARLWQATRLWWSLILAIALAAGAAAFIASQFVPKEYTTESAVLIGGATDSSSLSIAGYQHLTQTYAQLATTSPVLAQVASRLKLTTDLATLARQVDARAATDSTILTITARAGTAAEAAGIADAVASEIVRIATPVDQGSLATVVQPAALPISPTSPRTLLNLALGLGLGLALGLALAVFLVMRSERGRLGSRDHEQVVSLLEERFGRRAG